MLITVSTDDGRHLSGRIDEVELGRLALNLPFAEYGRVVRKLWAELRELEESNERTGSSGRLAD